ncbi:putative mitochondrial protein, partial [Mucuna pruriens]
MDPAQMNYTTTEKELLAIEFNLEIKDRKGADNMVADHVSRVKGKVDPDDPYLWRCCNDHVIRRCIPDSEIRSVLHFCHSTLRGEHYGSTQTTRKVLECGFYWPTIFRDSHQFVSACEQCQKAETAISRRNEIPQQPVLFCEIFGVWGIDFMGPFPISNGYSYILLAIDYVSRWMEAKATKTNDAKATMDFLKSNIFYWFGVPKALISDQGTHFCNRAMFSLLEKYGVVHRIVTPYHLRPTA